MQSIKGGVTTCLRFIRQSGLKYTLFALFILTLVGGVLSCCILQDPITTRADRRSTDRMERGMRHPFGNGCVFGFVNKNPHRATERLPVGAALMSHTWKCNSKVRVCTVICNNVCDACKNRRHISNRQLRNYQCFIGYSNQVPVMSNRIFMHCTNGSVCTTCYNITPYIFQQENVNRTSATPDTPSPMNAVPGVPHTVLPSKFLLMGPSCSDDLLVKYSEAYDRNWCEVGCEGARLYKSEQTMLYDMSMINAVRIILSLYCLTPRDVSPYDGQSIMCYNDFIGYVGLEHAMFYYYILILIRCSHSKSKLSYVLSVLYRQASDHRLFGSEYATTSGAVCAYDSVAINMYGMPYTDYIIDVFQHEVMCCTHVMPDTPTPTSATYAAHRTDPYITYVVNVGSVMYNEVLCGYWLEVGCEGIHGYFCLLGLAYSMTYFVIDIVVLTHICYHVCEQLEVRYLRFLEYTPSIYEDTAYENDICMIAYYTLVLSLPCIHAYTINPISSLDITNFYEIDFIDYVHFRYPVTDKCNVILLSALSVYISLLSQIIQWV